MNVFRNFVRKIGGEKGAAGKRRKFYESYDESARAVTTADARVPSYDEHASNTAK